MKGLKQPAESLVSKLTAEVEYAERLTVYKFNPRLGPVPVEVYSLEEAVGILSDPMAAVDLAVLADWAERVFSDLELAASILAIKSKKLSRAKEVEKSRDLMAIRLHQCRKLF